jgi:tRNA uridine 5-carboxymethylaminomethyl modification enzyme
MFTSRAEYRLLLREDNADLRLTERGRELGLVDDRRWASFTAKREAIEVQQRRLEKSHVHPGTQAAERLAYKLEKPLSREYSGIELLRRPQLCYEDVANALAFDPVDPRVAEQVEIQARYAGYIDRQQDDIERLRRNENVVLPDTLDYADIAGLSHEVRQKLSELRPRTLAQAGRIPGVTPAALSLLLIHLKKCGALDRRTA